MKKFAYLSGLLGVATFFFSGAASANVPTLQVAPLSYAGNLRAGVVEAGYVDVANPSDESIQVTSSVQGFRQIDLKGDLSFFDSAAISQGVSISLPTFTLGPRQAIRVGFTLDPTKLPHGGVYGAIFFRTVPSSENSSSSFIMQSANVGTLLLLTNGHVPTPSGQLNLSMPVFEFGSDLSGTASFKNLDASESGVGVRPSLRTKVTPWGTSVPFDSGLVLPGVTRDFSFTRSGSYFGILPITAQDAVTGAKTTTWIIAVTGLYRLGVPLGVLLLILLYLFIMSRKRKPEPAQVINKPMDGLSRRAQLTPAPAVEEASVESKLEELESATLAEESGLQPEAPESKSEELPIPVKKRESKPVSKKTKKPSRKPKKDAS